jgi:hypothetical protein
MNTGTLLDLARTEASHLGAPNDVGNLLIRAQNGPRGFSFSVADCPLDPLALSLAGERKISLSNLQISA